MAGAQKNSVPHTLCLPPRKNGKFIFPKRGPEMREELGKLCFHGGRGPEASLGTKYIRNRGSRLTRITSDPANVAEILA